MFIEGLFDVIVMLGGDFVKMIWWNDNYNGGDFVNEYDEDMR